jgi:hypothetical protein
LLDEILGRNFKVLRSISKSHADRDPNHEISLSTFILHTQGVAHVAKEN